MTASPLRCWLLAALTAAWAWAGSVFTPWALDLDHRLWLYDTLYYAGFALLAWGLVELALEARGRGIRRRRVATAPPLALAALAGAAALLGDDSAVGLRIKTLAGAEALAAERAQGDSDARRRVGGFLVDTRRHPCSASQPWLWLGRPFGGGTGTGRALVFAGDGPPQVPFADAFRVRPVAGGWWLAYQHGAAYARAERDAAASPRPRPCVDAQRAATHRQGRAFIDAGRTR